MKCQKCNEENLDSARFCKNCGEKLFQAGNQIPQDTAQFSTPRGKRNNVVIGIVVAGMVLVVGSVLAGQGFFANRNGSVNSGVNSILSSFSCGSQVKDIDGNAYGTVLVGTQCWMAENMNVGVKIIDGKSEATNNGKIEKWCYNDDSDICKSDGGLYTWNEAMQYSITEGVQGICPGGWHIPTDAEQFTLENYLKDPGQVCDSARDGLLSSDGCDGAGTKLMNGGSSGMNFPTAGNWNGDSFGNRGTIAYFWSSSKSDDEYFDLAWNRILSHQNSSVDRGYQAMSRIGESVRCLKD